MQFGWQAAGSGSGGRGCTAGSDDDLDNTPPMVRGPASPAGSRPERPRPASRWSTARPGNARTWSPRDTWLPTRRRGRGVAGARSGFGYSYPPPTGRCLVSRAGALVQS